MKSLVVIIVAALAVWTAAANSISSEPVGQDHQALAIKADKDGNMQLAIKHFREGVKVDPDNAIAWNNLGVALMRWAGELTGNGAHERRVLRIARESRDAFQMAIALDPEDTLSSENLQDLVDHYFDGDKGSPPKEPPKRPAKRPQPRRTQKSKKKKTNVNLNKWTAPLVDDDAAAPASRPSSRPASATSSSSHAPASRPVSRPGSRSTPKAPEVSATPSRARKSQASKSEWRLALNLLNKGDKKQAAEVLCTHDGVRVYVSDEAKRQRPWFFVAESAAILQVCGFVIVQNVMDKEALQRIATAHEPFLDNYLKMPGADDSDTANSPTSAVRSKQRYELKLPMTEPFFDSGVVDNKYIRPIVNKALGSSKLELDTHSTVTSMPHSPVQHWHRDVSFLFPATPLDANIPPQGIVMFTPLQDTSVEMGPTDFIPASHFRCDDSVLEKVYDQWALEVCPWTPESILHTSAELGDVVLFDIRSYHRGGQNRSDKRRSILYTTYMREWYFDRVNFVDRQSRQLDDIPKGQRKLYSRLDNRHYIQTLEDAAREAGVDIDALRATTYKFQEFHAGVKSLD